MPRVVAFREYNELRINDPGDKLLKRVIHQQIKVTRKISEKEYGQFNTYMVDEPCYMVRHDCKGEMYYLMGYGFVERLTKAFRDIGVSFVVLDVTPNTVEDIDRLVPNMDVVRETAWRGNQLQLVDAILEHDVGQIVAATGAGKTFTIAKLCMIFPRANILVTTYSTKVLKQLYKSVLSQSGVSAGIYSSEEKRPAGRVLFCTLGCLQHFQDRVWDILVLDEKHECGTIKRMTVLNDCRSMLAYAFSANDKDRADLADDWLESRFGPTRIKLSHEDAVQAKEVTPIHVEWFTAKDPDFPDYDAANPHFDKQAYSRNEKRNLLIADVAKKKSAEGQTLIYVKTVEHAYQLKKILDCPVAHGPCSADRWRQLQRAKLVPKDSSPAKAKDFDDLQEQFSAGKVPLAVCTSVWERGLNFPSLQTLIRADGGTTRKTAVQVPGRLTRLNEGKVKGVLVDFVDDYHSATYRKSSTRRKIYRELGYKQGNWGSAKI